MFRKHINIATIHISPTRVIAVLLVLAAVFYVAFQFTDLQVTIDLLKNSSWLWLSLAIVAMAVGFVVSAYIQYVAGDYVGKIKELHLLVYAGSFLNHFLPFSVGGIGLVAKYYNKRGQTKSQAIVSATAPIVVGAIATLIIGLIISPATFLQMIYSLHSKSLSYAAPWIIAGFFAIISIVALLFRKRLKNTLREAVVNLRGIHGLKQMTKIAYMSIGLAVVMAFMLYASICSIHAYINFIDALTIYILSMFVSEITPIPGGVVATEAVLILGLTGAGLNPSQAVAAALIFRFISFILPIIPGAIMVVILDKIMR